MDEFRIQGHKGIYADVVKSSMSGADELVVLRSRSPDEIYSITGFIQHFFRGQPTHRTELDGIVSIQGSTPKFVGGLDRQWEVFITSSVQYLNTPSLFGGSDIDLLKGKIRFRKFSSEVSIFVYDGTRPAFLNFVVPFDGNSFTSGVVQPNAAVAQSIVYGEKSHRVLFAEYVA